MKAEHFIDAGGDLNSTAALLVGMELALATDDLAAEFGHLPLSGTK
jgi:hypothetical protein